MSNSWMVGNSLVNETGTSSWMVDGALVNETTSTGITGTATGDADTTGTATGSVSINGVATGTSDTTGTATGTVTAGGPVTGTASGDCDTTGSASGTAGTPKIGGSIPRWYEEMRTSRPRKRWLMPDEPTPEPVAPIPVVIARKQDAIADLARGIMQMQQDLASQHLLQAQAASKRVAESRARAMVRNKAALADTEAQMARIASEIEELEAEHEAEMSLENDLIFVTTILMNA